MARSSLQRRPGRRLAGLLGPASAAVLLLAPSPARAYCRTSVCNQTSTGKVCTPAAAADCGVVISWPSQCVGFSMQQDASKEVSLAAATQVFQDAFNRWTSADCGGGQHPGMVTFDLGQAQCNRPEYNKTLGNDNVIMFRDDLWEYGSAGNAIALTTVTYDLDNGTIYDADMELNSVMLTFTVGDTGVVYDLASIAQHETGHFLGLSHSPDPHATMYPEYNPGSTSLRTLSVDDQAGLCAIYPPAPQSPSCDPTPRHGLSLVCAAQQSAGGGCQVAALGAAGGGGAAVSFALLALAALRRRGAREAG